MGEALRQKVLEAAYKSDRSLNAEILARLEGSFESDAAAKAIAETVDAHETVVVDHEDRIKQLERDVERLLDAAGLYE